MKRYLLIFMLCLVGVISANAQKDTIRVLSLGNSYARDAFSYAPMLIEELSPKTYVEFGILYIGSCTLQKHWENAKSSQEQAVYEYDLYTTEQKSWNTRKNVSLQGGLKERKWDLVILQQQSKASMDYRTHMPYLNNLLTYIHKVLPEASFAWHLTPAYPDGSKYMPSGTTSETMWKKTSTAARQVMLHDEFKFVIPTGTALQNARHTSLDHFGDFKHMSYEGLHLQEGIPCLVEAYTATQSLANFFNLNINIANSNLKITQDYVVKKHVPQRHGDVQTISATDYSLAKDCAANAIKTPYKINAPSDKTNKTAETQKAQKSTTQKSNKNTTLKQTKKTTKQKSAKKTSVKKTNNNQKK